MGTAGERRDDGDEMEDGDRRERRRYTAYKYIKKKQ